MKPMKEGLNPAAIERMATSLRPVFPEMDTSRFLEDACNGLDQLELKERVDHLIRVLAQHLPQDFATAAAGLAELPHCWQAGDPNDPMRGFAAWPVTDYVAHTGLQMPAVALPVLAKLTPLFSAEFAIRPFLQNHYAMTYQQMLDWCEHPDEHVRRLATEGIRPRLPWGIRLKRFMEDPRPVIDLLTRLLDDPALYVRRSVANNLNDISKDHPDLVIEICREWLAQSDTANTSWIVKHASRGLIKQGHTEAFSLLGYSHDPQIRVNLLRLQTASLKIGETLEFELQLEGLVEQQTAVVDYAVHHRKANGRSSPKVFKLKAVSLDKGQQETLNKRHSFKPVTTRKYYPGEHYLGIHINGVEKAGASFYLEG